MDEATRQFITSSVRMEVAKAKLGLVQWIGGTALAIAWMIALVLILLPK